MDGMQDFENKIAKLSALAEGPEITIIATGTHASKVLDIFAAQTKLAKVRTVIIDDSMNAKALTHIDRKIILDELNSTTPELVAEMLPKTDLLVILAALGGHTSNLLVPVIAEIGQKLGCLVVAVPIMPFSFEKERRESAKAVLEQIKGKVHFLTVIDNDHIPKKLKMAETTSYTARRLETLLDTLLPTVPFAVVQRIIKELEDDINKIRVCPQQKIETVVIPATNKIENPIENPIEIVNIIVEKIGNTTPENKIEEDFKGDNTLRGVRIAEEMQKISNVPKPPETDESVKPEKSINGNVKLDDFDETQKD
ncbi:MAG: hypothetical protein ACPL1Y_00645 [Thermoplasmata archaeon]